ncbi:MAG: PKD domain-containing protein, partial [Candidatus Cloacimonetes bacterium]|nr:PKD domain-containing protein [Candidatus Cloacimonadota bacterium]
MWDDPATYPYFIPLIWQGDGPNPSPGYGTRASMYGVGGIPHCQWGGSQNYIGGGTSTLPAYINLYNNIAAQDSPAEMDLELNTNSQGQLAFLLDVTLTSNITTTNNQIVYVLTHDWEPGQSPDYFASVILYEQEPFDLTTAGQTGSYEYAFDMPPNWDLAKMKAIAMIQTFGGNHQIHQAAITDFSGLLPMFTTNVTEGPAHLGVQFTNNSFPLTGIDSWEWDFDGDGEIDSTEENPYHLYTEPGSYDVTLIIEVDGEFAEITVEDYITVTDGSLVSGNLSGVWVPAFSPYTISGDITIAEGDELIINSDVELQ